MTNKYKQNLRYKKTSERINRKVKYDGLNKDEINYIKTKREYELVDKDLNYFYSNCKRKKSGCVDWESMSEKELDYFDYIYKMSERLMRKISTLSEKIDVEKTELIFMQINTHSVSF